MKTFLTIAILIFLFSFSGINASAQTGDDTGLPIQSWGVLKLKENKLFMHVFQWPTDGKLYVGGLLSPFGKAYLLSNPELPLPVKRVNKKDVYISIPKNALDTISTVIVLELNDKIEVDATRFISSNIPITRLLALDASQHGNGFIFGDSKKGKYYVEGWKNKDQYLSWRIRTMESARYRIIIRYLTGENCGGAYLLTVDDTYEFGYSVNSDKNNSSITQELAELTITGGTHVISLQPTSVTKGELMKLLEIQLIPVED